jgi:hypothetical protein
MEVTLRYLNSQLVGARFFGVELIRFEGAGLAVLEARTILRPSQKPGPSAELRTILDETRFLDRVSGPDYRETLRNFFAACRGARLSLAWGSSGASVRFALPATGKPASVAWLFPPGVSGWMGLADVTAGYAPSKSDDPEVRAAFEAYVQTAGALPGATPIDRVGLRGVRIAPETADAALPQVMEAVGVLMRRLGAA